jgi:hypothetical protein
VQFSWNIWIGTKIALFLFQPTNAQIYITTVSLYLMYTVKKQKLNAKLCKIHIACANYWKIMWQYIQRATNLRLNKMMDSIYQKLNKKLDALQEHKSHNKHNKETMKYTFHTLLVTLTQLKKTRVHYIDIDIYIYI